MSERDETFPDRGDRRGRRRAYWALARQIGGPHAVGGEVPARLTPVERPALPAEDVEVGFPSMQTFVPGMRRAFFGADDSTEPATQQAEIALTVQQATDGACVPFDLTVRHTCPMCGGRGELWPESCDVCDGSGTGWVSHQLDIPVPPGVRDGSCLRFAVSPPYAAKTHLVVRIAVQ